MPRRRLRSGRSAPWWFALMLLIIGILGTVVFLIAVSGVLPSVTGSGR